MDPVVPVRKKRVYFEIRTEPGKQVYVAGTFNDWNPTSDKLEERKGGLYCSTLVVPVGEHEYKFVIDGAWCVDPMCSQWRRNDHGSTNSIIRVE